MKITLNENDKASLLLLVFGERREWQEELDKKREAWEKAGYDDVIEYYEQQIALFSKIYEILIR